MRFQFRFPINVSRQERQCLSESVCTVWFHMLTLQHSSLNDVLARNYEKLRDCGREQPTKRTYGMRAPAAGQTLPDENCPQRSRDKVSCCHC